MGEDRPHSVDRGVRLPAAELLALLPFTGLAVLVARRKGPLPGDVALERAVQGAILPRRPVKRLLDTISSLTWPRPAFAGIGIAAALLTLSKRPWASVSLVTCALLSNDSGYHVSRLVRRPRPSGHGVRVEKHVRGTYGFPSGHVVHSTAALGYMLYLSSGPAGPLHPVVAWALRLFAAPIVLTIGISRIASGEHWVSDVLAGRLLGLAWLLAFIRLHRRRPGR
jgi:membrane-associated phospholipid phosphatase